jgi:hypothetical protein
MFGGAPGLDPFFGPGGPGGGGGPDDLLSQLLLAGARSAHANAAGGGTGSGHTSSGFMHFDPSSGGQARHEAAAAAEPGIVGGGLEALIGALMGQGLFSSMAEGVGGAGGFYEDLVGLDNVHVTTPPDVLAALPRSTYIQGRRPGDRCVGAG